MQKHLYMIGACALDTILTVPYFPEEDSKLRASSMYVRRGGNCANSLEVLQQLVSTWTNQSTPSPSPSRPASLSLHLVAVLPRKGTPSEIKIRDSFGPDSTVDLRHCIWRDGSDEASTSFIFRSAETGSRTIVNYNSVAEMATEEFTAIADSVKTEMQAGGNGDGGSTWWHFEGRNTEITLQCIGYLRAKLPRCTISVEVEKPNREGLIELAAEADVVFYSKTWAEHRGYTNAEACLRGEAPQRASLAVCTWGAQGACSLSLPRGDSVQCRPAPPSPDFRIVDTIGAGDTLIAGMLFGLICHADDDDWDAEARLRFAVDLATRKVQRDGFAGLVASATATKDAE